MSRRLLTLTCVWLGAAAIGVTALAVPAGGQTGSTRCEVVTYTPPTASAPQLATLCVPASLESQTAVVLVHGGGGYGGSRHDLTAWQDHYGEQGVVTLSIDYALFDEASGAGRYPLPEQNTKAAVQYVRIRSAELGVEDVVIQGHSAGARLAAFVATTAGDTPFLGPELWLGVSDAVDGFVGLYGYYDGFQYFADSYFGTAADPLTPTDRAGQATGPALLIHGEDDALVTADQSSSFAAQLRAEDQSVQLSVVAQAGHGFDGYGQPTLSPEGEQVAHLIEAWLEQEV
jgi:acetyl esterase/lipase